MGFSLTLFFKELEDELNKSNIFTLIPRLRKLIKERKQYAKECGHIR